MSARLLFIGLLNFADDRGNLVRSAKKIKMQVFPADAIDCEPLIQELLNHGVLIEYSVNGDKYLNIKGFIKHQVINRPSASNIPDIDSGITHGLLSEPSLTEGKGREGKGKEEEPIGSVPTVPEKQKQEPTGFEHFWKTWPSNDRKQGKGKCLDAWKKAKAETDWQAITAHVEALKSSRDWQKNNGEFVPSPLVYLNQRRWDGAESAQALAIKNQWAGAV